MTIPVSSETRGHRRQFNNLNAGELHQEQSRNLQARTGLLSGATANVYCVPSNYTHHSPTSSESLPCLLSTRECVPTRTRGGVRCQLAQKRVVPFRSFKVGTSSLFGRARNPNALPQMISDSEMVLMLSGRRDSPSPGLPLARDSGPFPS